MDSIVSAAIQHGKLEKRFFDEEFDTEKLRIVVLGTGGAGNNTINRLQSIGIEGAELIAVNTDRQDLMKISGNVTKVLIGPKVTRGLGAGGFPEIGEKAAEASRHELQDLLANTHLLFLTAGMGGGTGTGSAPVIAEIARDLGAIVVAIVTFPFALERSRLDKARAGIEKLRKVADTVIIIDNNKLVEYVPNLPIDKAFSVADEVVARAVKGITETIMEPSLINLDFADIKAVLNSGDVALISVGEGEGPDRVELAVNNTLKQPLLDVDYKGATGALIHITGGEDLTLGEANAVGQMITAELNPDATVTWGARIDPKIRERIEVIAIITGVNSPNILGRRLKPRDSALFYTEDFYEWSKDIDEI
ncbi:MAG TPA: cell division protein FtsZ [Candidatus Altiarchaeales archaeon]|nr:MAG: cell division protein FtsZ [Candidatus Altiarchaeales archaeon]HDN83640.1 cell division protein FtsZ [Candidatus Altiarchaeales archaeon]